MGISKKLFQFILVISFIFSGISNALTPKVKNLVDFETKANAVTTRSNEMILLPHVEIPLELVGVDFAKRIDPKIANALVITKNRKRFVRWVLNPEDTMWGDKVIEYFKSKHNLVLEKKYYLHGYQTSSRSYIAEDPKTGAQFSIKSSTNKTGGLWCDKKQPVGEAIDSRIISDFLTRQNQKRPFEHFIFLDEPAIFTLTDIDQAVVVRDLDILKNPQSNKFFVPGFSVLHEKIGAKIAELNRSNDPYKFWTEHYIKVAGKALGELAARTGMQFDSPHSQNFLVELDEKLRPTGRLVIRDMADLYVDVNFIKAIEGEGSELLKRYTQRQNLTKAIQAGFGPLHGNIHPKWVNTILYNYWGSIFFESFESTFYQISGFNLASLNMLKYRNGDYFSTAYNLKKEKSFNDFFDNLKQNGYLKLNSTSPLLCSKVFKLSP